MNPSIRTSRITSITSNEHTKPEETEASMKQHAHSRAHRLVAAAGVLALTLTITLQLDVTPAHAADDELVQPVTGYVSGTVANRCPGSDNHAGIDITRNGIQGAPIGAALNGTVTASGWLGGYGNAVKLSHPSGHETLYAHMAQNPGLALRSTVTKGQTIGQVGNTGNSYGPHLHFEVTRSGSNIGNSLGYYCGQNVTKGASLRAGSVASTGRGLFDVNSDGNSDLLAIRNDGMLVHYYGNGGAGFRSSAIGGGWGGTSAIVHGDFTSDRKGDLIRVVSNGTMWLYQGNGAGGYTSRQVGNGWSSFSLITGGVDVNRDGHADIIARSDGALYLYAGNGAGGFSRSYIGGGWDSMTALVIGDFDGNGYADILARRTTGELFAYLRNANGYASGVQIGSGWQIFSTLTGGADYNGDGIPDVIARRASDNTLWLYTGTGRGEVTSGRQIGSGWGSFPFIS